MDDLTEAETEFVLRVLVNKHAEYEYPENDCRLRFTPRSRFTIFTDTLSKEEVEFVLNSTWWVEYEFIHENRSDSYQLMYGSIIDSLKEKGRENILD